MTDQPTQFNQFDRDPEAIAWARTKVQSYIDQLVRWEEEAKEREAGAKATGIAVSRLLAERHFLGNNGCVIGAFDERRPAVAKAMDRPGILVDTTIELTVPDPSDAEEIGRQVGRALRRTRFGEA
jgi:hypothetical protein